MEEAGKGVKPEAKWQMYLHEGGEVIIGFNVQITRPPTAQLKKDCRRFILSQESTVKCYSRRTVKFRRWCYRGTEGKHFSDKKGQKKNPGNSILISEPE